MPSPTDIIAAVLRRPVFRRPIVGHELRGSQVQLLGRNSDVTWTATVPQLAEAIDTALLKSDEKDTPFVPCTERERWVRIADALNEAHSAGMPVGIDLDGTLTDHRMWSVVWDQTTRRWTVAGYEDQTEAAPAVEEKDTQTGSQPAGAASTARTEILRALQAYGHSDASALVVLRRADHEPHDPDPNPDFRETLDGGHALVVEYGDCEMHASCQCGTRFGLTTPDASLDTFVPAWEHHTNTEVS
ncbi:hypothetical protein [Streptomyces graminilatus]|uniref:hypothetical protein n=1 Tax=Streptomyces graminilatus TaxID=1464070 RepID=UPI0006E1D278|nr:hypothetical protein [Streptomyces graminilatus]